MSKKLPAFVQAKIKNFTPIYKDLKFENSLLAAKWVTETTAIEIHLEDKGQDLITFYVAANGEIIHVETMNLASIYVGALLLDEMETLLQYDTIALWIPKFNEVSYIKYPVEKVVRIEPKPVVAERDYKVFQITHSTGDTETYVGQSLESVQDHYKEEGQWSQEGATWKELTNEEIENLVVDLTSFQEEAPADGWPDSMKFTEFVKSVAMYGGQKPELVCSTDF